MNKSYCLKCKKEVSEDTKECECGNKSFIYGAKFHLDEVGVVCDCGNNKFNSNMHIDYKDKSATNYKCTKCGNPIGTETYRDEEDLMYWE